MYFEQEIIRVTSGQECHIFVDMDGVITDYEFSQKLDF